MAAAVDSTKLLLEPILKSLRRTEEVLAIIGLLYVGHKTVSFSWSLVKGVRNHFWSRLWNKQFLEKYGKWAVVTGGTDGIGKAYARELAKNGMNLILVARNQQKLEQVAQEIGTEFAVETVTVLANFCGDEKIYPHICNALQEKDIGVLVNNVGTQTSLPAPLVEVSDDDIWRLIKVNSASMPLMTKLVLPGMLERKRGAVINIGSIAALMPFPLYATYSGTKAFVDSFSLALAEEVRGSGVTVQTVHPGVVATNMSSFPGIGPIKRSLTVPTASEFAISAINTLGYTDHTTGYWPHGIQIWIASFFPPWYNLRTLKKLFMRIRDVSQSASAASKSKNV
ncbi:unnamed protein product [Meganyctiphanes norvegica]|uniref:Inactive hydroxysteroid dehydrogenase-like protein 1 n=1 Tax=Meganyctiphanes norvegica TaxID=48144 RepID=A0AAV2R323_MEGNR